MEEPSPIENGLHPHYRTKGEQLGKVHMKETEQKCVNENKEAGGEEEKRTTNGYRTHGRYYTSQVLKDKVRSCVA